MLASSKVPNNRICVANVLEVCSEFFFTYLKVNNFVDYIWENLYPNFKEIFKLQLTDTSNVLSKIVIRFSCRTCKSLNILTIEWNEIPPSLSCRATITVIRGPIITCSFVSMATLQKVQMLSSILVCSWAPSC